MPLATIQIWEGPDRQRKQKLIEAVRQAMITYGGLKPEEIYIVVQDLARHNYTIKEVYSSEDALTCATVCGCTSSETSPAPSN
ncbi:tautomerase family protein [Moorella sp. ACPs]|uniref:tautomerase family protein n=1 Tax=Neomoorella carbonis TaxID=3062783 RepID=UPI00324E4004